MRGLEKKKTAHNGADRQTDRHTDRRTWRLLDQLGPEGQVGENLLSWIVGRFVTILLTSLLTGVAGSLLFIQVSRGQTDYERYTWKGATYSRSPANY